MGIEPYIDAHSHVWTPDIAHYPLAKGFGVQDMKPASFTAAELLKLCRPSGVGRVNLIQMSFYEFDNSYILDTIKLDPDRFVGTAIVDPLSADPAKTMAELEPKGIRACRIAPNFSKLPAERWLEPKGYEAMFAAAPKLGMALSCLINPEGFAEVDRMAQKFPETRIVIDHIGRIGIDGTIRDADVAALVALAAHKNIYMKIGAFYALGKKMPPYVDLASLIERVVKGFGSDRCMWESDCPFQVVKDTYDQSIGLVRDKLPFLSGQDQHRLMSLTAEAVFFHKK